MPLRKQIPHDARHFPSRQRQVIHRLRLSYTIALLGCFLFLGLYPTWIGHTYQLDADDVRSSGRRFEIGGSIDGKRVPVWEPPRASSQGTVATVRWPWQTPHSPCHVAIDETDFFFWLLACVLVLGIALKMGYLVFAPDVHDLFVTVALCISFVLVIVLIFLMWIASQMA